MEHMRLLAVKNPIVTTYLKQVSRAGGGRFHTLESCLGHKTKTVLKTKTYLNQEYLQMQ